jgi:Holliday junction resolvase-like predicted endonuclease
MKNPSEEIVTAWLQECKQYFTMNNIKVHRKGGGMGAEIDILATNRRKNIWVEVSVSTRPRCGHKKEVRLKETVNDYLADFRRKDKRKKVEEFFGKNYEKWFVHGRLPLSKDEASCFPKRMEQKGVHPVYFGKIFKDMLELKEYRLDAARGYMNLFKAFQGK